jgi:hypothetical protein
MCWRRVSTELYDRLIIVYPVTLGDLRSAISDRVRAKIVGESLMMTKIPSREWPNLGRAQQIRSVESILLHERLFNSSGLTG